MIKEITHFKAVFIFFLTIYSYFAFAQIHTQKVIAKVSSAPSKENYISRTVIKNGIDDHGLFTDTLSGKILPSDPVSIGGKQFQDIHLTLEYGEAFKATVETNFNATLTLFSTVNGKLIAIKTGTYTYFGFNLVYKAIESGSYTLRVICNDKVPKDKNMMKYFYENESWYRLTCKIAIEESAKISFNAPLCERIEFLLRHSETDFMQLAGNAIDTTMDDVDKKKISSIYYRSSFNLGQNRTAKISISEKSFNQYSESFINYPIEGIAERAQKSYQKKIQDCLGSKWKGEINPNTPTWYDFTREGFRTIHIILDSSDKEIRIRI